MKNYNSPELTIIDTTNMEGVFAGSYNSYRQGRNNSTPGSAGQQATKPSTDNQISQPDCWGFRWPWCWDDTSEN